VPHVPPVVIDMGDLDLDVDLGDLSLEADQLAELEALFESERVVVEPAREALEELADDLREELEDPDADEAKVEQLIDAISEEEAKIRKAEVMALVKSRKVLDAKQRAEIEKNGARVKVMKLKKARKARGRRAP
jgi:Spy/CpxP family protein refolding chaperone